MPIIRMQDGEEGEAIAGAVGGAKVAPDVARVASNITMAEHIGKFVAGEMVHRFSSENLADRLKGRNAIHVSFSWG